MNRDYFMSYILDDMTEKEIETLSKKMALRFKGLDTNRPLFESKEEMKKTAEFMAQRWERIAKNEIFMLNGMIKKKKHQIMMLLQNNRPNALEQRFIDMIEKHNLPYKYVGDGRFLIGGRNPDFMNINGQKKLIEVFGIYYHSPLKNPKIRWKSTYNETIRHYKKHNYKCMIIWDYELNDEKNIMERLKNY